MPYSGTYNTSHGYQPIQYGCTDRHISSGKCFIRKITSNHQYLIANKNSMQIGSSSSDVLTSKDISASQSDITSIIQQTNQSKFIHFSFCPTLKNSMRLIEHCSDYHKWIKQIVRVIES